MPRPRTPCRSKTRKLPKYKQPNKGLKRGSKRRREKRAIPLNELPLDLQHKVVQKLNCEELKKFGLTNKSNRDICKKNYEKICVKKPYINKVLIALYCAFVWVDLFFDSVVKEEIHYKGKFNELIKIKNVTFNDTFFPKNVNAPGEVYDNEDKFWIEPFQKLKEKIKDSKQNLLFLEYLNIFSNEKSWSKDFTHLDMNIHELLNVFIELYYEWAKYKFQPAPPPRITIDLTRETEKDMKRRINLETMNSKNTVDLLT